MLELRGKTVLVLGAIETGVHVSQYLSGKSAKVFLFGKPAEEDGFRRNVKELSAKIQLHFGETLPEDFAKPDFVIFAQAKEKYQVLIDRLMAQGIPVYSALEFICALSEAKVVAVTGTNGKSTTIKMIDLMLQKSQVPATLAGGSFASFIEAIQSAQKSKLLLLEVNSHQLQDSENFHPAIAVMTNLTKAHYERHGRSNTYARAKAKIFARQGTEDILIYNADNAPLVKMAKEAASQKFPVFVSTVPNPFGKEAPQGPHVRYAEKIFHLTLPDGVAEKYSTHNMQVRTQHFFENAMEAVACARLLGAKPPAIQQALEEFTGLPHRMQKIVSARGVDWYDDSRASNPAATSWGIWGFKKKVILITGGRETYIKYELMAGAVKAQVKLLILVGQSRRRMDAALEDTTEMFLVKTLEDAVKLAYGRAEKGDVVVYSPACPPEPGLFASMEARGELFAALIQKELAGDVRDKMARIHRLPGEPI